jgi:hypothetical protein
MMMNLARKCDKAVFGTLTANLRDAEKAAAHGTVWPFRGPLQNS